MKVTYRKLWALLALKEISKVELRKMLQISQSTFTKLNKNELVALSVLINICDKLDCDIGDIMEVVRDNDCAE